MRPHRMARQESVHAIIAYHDQTKHHPGQYARGPGYLDWNNQPDPFRRFAGTPVTVLPLAHRDMGPPAKLLFTPAEGDEPAGPLTLETLGLFLELSLGLSARKEVAGSSWYLRMNPSSGNLHPTEAYVLLPALSQECNLAGLYHYAPRPHALEQRARYASSTPPIHGFFVVGLTSIVWREAWKYGERAFRYCQHDIGHALACLRFSAAVLGWRVKLLPQFTDLEIARCLGLDRREDFRDAEMEVPELFVRVQIDPPSESSLSGREGETDPSNLRSTDLALPIGPPVQWFGQANRLSASWVEWPAIDEAIAGTGRTSACLDSSGDFAGYPGPVSTPPAGGLSAAQVIRQRRSAVSFDGRTGISRDQFLSILDTTLPRPETPPFDCWPFSPRIDLVLFVHRVSGLEPGLYLWLRCPAHGDLLRPLLQPRFEWKPGPELASPESLIFLGRGDLRQFARTVSCHQDIAADSAFSLGMLAQFEPVLQERGAAAYRELYWEAGMIGQALYLAAEVAGIRGTGIGCFLDDVMHRALGLEGHGWQSLYHFTMGAPVEDSRLRSQPPYEPRQPA